MLACLDIDELIALFMIFDKIIVLMVALCWVADVATSKSLTKEDE